MKTNQEKYVEMVCLYIVNEHDLDALNLARELITSDLPLAKMRDVEHVYFACGGH